MRGHVGPTSPDEGVPSERARVEALRVLGLPRRARLAEVREAYIRLARELHPDLNANDPNRAEQFRVVAAAYELLRRYHRHLQPAGVLRRDGAEYDALWWRQFGEKI